MGCFLGQKGTHEQCQKPHPLPRYSVVTKCTGMTPPSPRLKLKGGFKSCCTCKGEHLALFAPIRVGFWMFFFTHTHKGLSSSGEHPCHFQGRVTPSGLNTCYITVQQGRGNMQARVAEWQICAATLWFWAIVSPPLVLIPQAQLHHHLGREGEEGRKEGEGCLEGRRGWWMGGKRWVDGWVGCSSLPSWFWGWLGVKVTGAVKESKLLGWQVCPLYRGSEGVYLNSHIPARFTPRSHNYKKMIEIIMIHIERHAVVKSKFTWPRIGQSHFKPPSWNLDGLFENYSLKMLTFRALFCNYHCHWTAELDAEIIANVLAFTHLHSVHTHLSNVHKKHKVVCVW